MAYSELIKNFERIRFYMREFYVYGFKSRNDFHHKSRRSYDNERRRIESYLNDYMAFHQSSSGKNIFLSIDSRSVAHNPLYQALKSKSFTNGDITLHFIIFDILYEPNCYYTLNEMITIMDEEYLSYFDQPLIVDESTIRKKLKEYRQLGLIHQKKQGKQICYARNEMLDLSSWKDAISFFSEEGMNGVIGSFLLDKFDTIEDYFVFKHHYITHALESEVLYELFKAIRKENKVAIKYDHHKYGETKKCYIIPLKIFVSSQSGRNYLLGYDEQNRMIKSYRLDFIMEVKIKEKSHKFDDYYKKLLKMENHMWGVASNKRLKSLEHVEFTICIKDNEEFIYQRLLREKRNGVVEKMNENTYVFKIDVYDTSELIPWIRTFISRITQLNFSNRSIENQFKKDIEAMYQMYLSDGGKG